MEIVWGFIFCAVGILLGARGYLRQKDIVDDVMTESDRRLSVARRWQKMVNTSATR